MLHIFHAVIFCTLVLLPTTAKSLVFALLHVSANCCSHHQRAVIL